MPKQLKIMFLVVHVVSYGLINGAHLGYATIDKMRKGKISMTHKGVQYQPHEIILIPLMFV